MLTKLETKSNRVKGISFHPSRPWILASLHSGVVQLWDYRIPTLVERFDEHDGPVRGVNFHPTQPLFVSGGDDYKIKVWNYKQRRCLFTLLGHLDYIRTVQFHHEYPWILSASDDQTIRIWNWQSRTCVAVLTGHNHYVMCAQFHPKEDLIVSASLDQTVRVWDISGLRKKNLPGMGFGHSSEEGLRIPQNDIFGNADAIVKFVLEGHDRGVNWAAFHPTAPLIVSGADDRHIKLWRMSDTKAWEVDTFRGHFNNVSCVIFHPRQELILSNSEDKTIRVWDISKRAVNQTIRREHERFWVIAAHPEINLFAAGHDNGMIVFKLERERPAYVSYQSQTLFYLKDKYIRMNDFSNNRDVPVVSIRKSFSSVKALVHSQADKALILTSDQDGGQYDLYQISSDASSDSTSESKRGVGVSVAFVGRQRFAVLDKTSQIVIKNLKNEEAKRFSAPHAIDYIWSAPLGNLLLRAEDKISLFDVSQKRVLYELNIANVKFISWSNESENPHLALWNKDTITLANKQLEQIASIHENIRIKSGAWDENGIFIYSTLNHIKYCLPNGDNGIIRTIDTVLYITGVKGNKVYCLDRQFKARSIAIDPTEYLFKFALLNRQFSVVLKMVREYNLIGQSIIFYLQKKGFPEIALFFVKDEKTRFNLALECGNIEKALESARNLDDKECWHRLGVEALRQGNHQIVEMAYQRTKNFEALSFIYLITGNIDKLKKMLKIAEMRGDIMSRFHNSLFLGDAEERVKILESCGLFSLAHITALTHGLKELAEGLAQKMGLSPENIPSPFNTAQLLFPPIPVNRSGESNWPLLNVSKRVFDDLALVSEKPSKMSVDIGTEEEIGGGEWEDGEEKKEPSLGEDEQTESTKKQSKEEEGEEEAWEVDLDLGKEVETIEVTNAKLKDKAFVVLPNSGPTSSQIWCNNSNLAVDHVAAGSFETAMKLLHQQVGVVNFAPLKEYFLTVYSGTRLSLPATASLPCLNSFLQRNPEMGFRNGLPLLPFSFQNLIEVRLKLAYKATTGGKFSDALREFLSILHILLLTVVESKKEFNEAKELINVCREYILGLKMELMRKELATKQTDTTKQTELAAYFTHCNLQSIHLMLSLRSAMNSAYKIKNYLHAASFARRLLELDPKEEVAVQAKKVVKFAETNHENAIQLNYDEKNPFVIDGKLYVPIFKGSPVVNCPYCGASYKPEHNGELCTICELCQIGKEISGLHLYNGAK